VGAADTKTRRRDIIVEAAGCLHPTEFGLNVKIKSYAKSIRCPAYRFMLDVAVITRLKKRT
jgi:hypothetical protein